MRHIVQSLQRGLRSLCVHHGSTSCSESLSAVGRGRILVFILLGLCSFAVSGCASVSVKNTQGQRDSTSKPTVIHVADFDTESGTWRVDRTGDALARLKAKISDQLANDMVKRLNKKVATAVRLPRGSSLPSSGWLVTGRFTRVNQGSRALRALVGLGAGGTKLETEVEIRDLSLPGAPVILRTETTGGTNAEPGAMFSVTTSTATLPFQLAGGLASKSAPGLSRDTIRTSRMIVAVISQFGVNHGWIKPESGMRPKELGSLPVMSRRQASKVNP
ncbi:hypothetical protein DB346_01270 [Verrucomicrobia bacterium LW23]|nr:hypothetical protein DB346_01270 [Verrucomicrobia bacterium LW23]